MSFVPRTYQREAVDSVIAEHADYRSCIGRGATGLGKAAILAMIAKHYSQFGRVMVLVDVVKLVHQLAETFEWVTGSRPGIEMGDLRASNGGFLHASDGDGIVISTFQTQYSGTADNERYRQFDPRRFSACLVDECETVFPTDNKSRSVVEWYLTNPNLKLFGCTATPFRSDGVAAANLFERVAFDYDILWGIENGWLVPAKQAFVRVNLDFSTLKLRENDEGEKDYSAADIAEKINNEQALVEIAKGILHVAGDMKSIVACPDVATAKAVSDYLNAEKTGCSQCIYGERGDEEKDSIFRAFDENEFQILTSVMMLTKGFDQHDIRCVFNCRKTKSKRLYQQLLGRGTRPLKGLLNDLGEAPAADRRAAIAGSGKPHMIMVNLVGVDEYVRDVTVVDILGSAADESVIEKAKQLEVQGISSEEALLMAEEQAEIDAAYQKLAGEMGQELADAVDDYRETQLRSKAEIAAHVEVEYRDDLAAVGTATTEAVRVRGPSPAQKRLLERQVYPDDLARMTPEAQRDLARQLVIRMQQGLCSYKQAKILRRNGYTREQTATMTRDNAKSILDELFGGRR